MTKDFTASVRIDKIRDRQHLQAMSRHSLRQDNASIRRQRLGSSLGHALHFSSLVKDGAQFSDNTAMRDVAKAYDQHRARKNISQTVQGSMGFHAMISVSSEWITAAGGQLHDDQTPRNRQLMVKAVSWFQSWCGKVQFMPPASTWTRPAGVTSTPS